MKFYLLTIKVFFIYETSLVDTLADFSQFSKQLYNFLRMSKCTNCYKGTSRCGSSGRGQQNRWVSTMSKYNEVFVL